MKPISLDCILEFPIGILIPGHDEMLVGEQQIYSVITKYRDAIEWVLKETLFG